MNEDTPAESGSITDREKYELRIEPRADPDELHKLPWRYLLPVLVPGFFWMAMPKYGPAWFAACAVLAFLGLWGMLRKERSIDTTNVNQELVLYILVAMFGGCATACCLVAIFLVA